MTDTLSFSIAFTTVSDMILLQSQLDESYKVIIVTLDQDIET